jgi:hypothetical protein
MLRKSPAANTRVTIYGKHIPLELFGEVAFAYLRLLASSLRKAASTNLGAIQQWQRHNA